MEKLLELLNQYEEERKSGYTWNSIDSYDNCVYGLDCDGETEITMYSDLYSKYYGFIKWLVDNDKIDYEKVKDKNEVNYDLLHLFKKVEKMLMLLSIQDKPIEFLVSIL